MPLVDLTPLPLNEFFIKGCHWGEAEAEPRKIKKLYALGPPPHIGVPGPLLRILGRGIEGHLLSGFVKKYLCD